MLFHTVYKQNFNVTKRIPWTWERWQGQPRSLRAAMGIERASARCASLPRPKWKRKGLKGRAKTEKDHVTKGLVLSAVNGYAHRSIARQSIRAKARASL